MQLTTPSAPAIGAAVLLAGLALGGCATKKFVNEQAGLADQRVSAVDTRLVATDKTARDALERAIAAGKLAEGKFEYAVVLSDDSVKFPTDVYAVSDDAKARLNELVARLKADNKNVYIEIQGHTDSVGATSYNEVLGEERAEAVRLFLNQQGVALNRLATISYGETAPVAPNNTRLGRAQNRRVVLIVMS